MPAFNSQGMVKIIERAEFEDKKNKIRIDQIGLENNIAGARSVTIKSGGLMLR